ncbi:MAG: membrane dipeptidase [Oscillospiraceae bacterium]|jgi:membrane dipeptidase|nr:membrane dipeptidase [Oscillospiraceae bacterium]
MRPVFDAHADTLSRLQRRGGDLLENDGHFDLRRAEAYGPAAQFFAAYGFDFEVLGPLARRLFAAHDDRVVLCRTAGEARRAGAESRLAAFLSLEGAEVVGCDETRLRAAWEQGARMVGLTWNHDNALAGGVGGAGGGLTPRGASFLRLARSLPMIIDVSHLSDRSFWDVAEAMEGTPFVASHSNARAVCDHPRNLTDGQFAALVSADGFAGINLYTVFLTAGETAAWEDVGAHIEHFAALGGVRHIGLGCDFDGCAQLPAGVRGIEDLGALYEWLLRKNYPEDTVRGIFYHNILRVVERICDM